jgi:hypothetical protein
VAKREDLVPDGALQENVPQPGKKKRGPYSLLTVHAVRAGDLDITAPEPPPELAGLYKTPEMWASLCRRIAVDRERRRDGEIERAYFRLHLQWARESLAREKLQKREADR